MLDAHLEKGVLFQPSLCGSYGQRRSGDDNVARIFEVLVV